MSAVLQISSSNHVTVQDWSSGNAVGLYAADSWFESRQGCCLS